MNQRGNIVLYVGLAIVGVVLASGLGMGIRYYQQKFSKPTQVEKSQPVNQTITQPAPAPSNTTVQILEDVTKDWKTYENNEFGFELKYPPEYSDPQYPNPKSGWGGGDIGVNVLINSPNGQNIYITGESLIDNSCRNINTVCDMRAQEKLVSNNINWDFLGIHLRLQPNCIDLGQCRPETSVYRTTNGGNNYYIFFEKENREHDILASFRFIR